MNIFTGKFTRASVRDNRIWRNSKVSAFLQSYGKDSLLLADQGYGLSPWIMTPFEDPSTPQQRAFNSLLGGMNKVKYMLLLRVFVASTSIRMNIILNRYFYYE